MLTQACAKAAGRGSALHLMGLVSGGGVHSDMGHLVACLELAGAREGAATSSCTPSSTGATRRRGAPRATWPTIQRGTWTGSASAATASSAAATTRWTGTRAGTASSSPTTRSSTAQGFFAADAQAAVDAAYARGENDEFVRPTIVAPERDPRVARRRRVPLLQLPPRPRPRAHARLHRERTSPSSTAAPTRRAVDFVTMTQYKKEFPLPVAFPPEHPEHVLADVLAEHGLRQLHIAETEKYAHVTFFFNGGRREGGAGGGAHPRAQPARRAHLRPQAGDERLRRHRRARRAAGARARTTSSSSTTRTPTWWGTPASSTRRWRRSRRSTPASAASSTWSRGSAAPASSPPTTATRTTCSSRTAARTRRTAPTWCRSSPPSTGVRVREGGRLCDLAPTALALLGLEHAAEMTGASLLRARPLRSPPGVFPAGVLV